MDKPVSPSHGTHVVMENKKVMLKKDNSRAKCEEICYELSWTSKTKKTNCLSQDILSPVSGLDENTLSH